jgi:hypothetical protein
MMRLLKVLFAWLFVCAVPVQAKVYLVSVGIADYPGTKHDLRVSDQDANTIHVRADIDQTEMWISLKDDLPLVLKMKNNPLGIDWLIER